MTTPKISVVVPVWNRASLIERCLDSVKNQSLQPTELIVVDNNSSDKTVEVVKQWIRNCEDSGIKIQLLSELKKGACAARQKGLENTEGDFVIFFDSDDVMLPGLLENITDKIRSNPETDIVCWKCRINQLDGTVKIPAFIPENPIESHLIHTLFRPQGFIVRKDFLLRAGGWNKPIEVWNDLELGLRLILWKPKLVAINKVLAVIYSQKDSITGLDFSSKEGKWESTLHEMEKENEKHSHPRNKKIKRILHYRKSILAAHYYLEGTRNGAANLIKETLKNKSFMEKLLLQFSYHFTRKGLRGVWRIVRMAY